VKTGNLKNGIQSQHHKLNKISRRARGGAEKNALLPNLASSTMIFYIFMIKTNMKEKSGFLITHGSPRPLRLCVIKFKKNLFKFVILSND
jgi:hypothetical protein